MENLKNNENEDIRLMHSALAEYQSTIVSSRFSVAGLYMAGTAFLIQAFFSDNIYITIKYIIIGFEIILTIAMALLEKRNSNLLENIGKRGRDIEKKLNLGNNSKFGFFKLLKKQPIPTKIFCIPKCIVICITSHSFGLCLIYLSSFIFWISILILQLQKD